MNDRRHEEGDADAAIDRAAKQLVMHEPPPRMYAAVMADIQLTADERRTAWRWPAWQSRWQWSLAAVSVPALLAIVLVVWNAQRANQPAMEVASAPPAPADVAKLAPPMSAGPRVIPRSPPQSTRPTRSMTVPTRSMTVPTRSLAVRAVRRPAAEPLAESSETGQPRTPPPQPQRPAEAIEVSTVAVNAIPMSAIPVTDIRVSSIPVGMDRGSPIAVSAIAVDSK